MDSKSQDNFRRDVKVWLAHRNMTVTALARRIRRRRDTVSTAIHSDRFPRVRARIAEEVGT